MIKLDEIYEPLARARNITAQIIYNVDQIEDTFITELIKKHVAYLSLIKDSTNCITK